MKPGLLLGRSATIKVLVRKSDRRGSRGTSLKRTLITALECISADGRALAPSLFGQRLHIAVSGPLTLPQAGTSLARKWIHRQAYPQTRARAQGKPRILINDGFAAHESLDVLEFCFKNNIVLCRLPFAVSYVSQAATL